MYIVKNKKQIRKRKMSKQNYYRTYNAWNWKPVAPETIEEKNDRKRREQEAARKMEENAIAQGLQKVWNKNLKRYVWIKK